MTLQILGDDSADVIAQMRSAIEGAIACDELEITSGSPGHFAIRVVSSDFEGKNRVKQQQLVYRAIAGLMDGDAAPVHAVDRLVCLTP
ncbi:MAG: BolA family protein [Myxococcota bacterium]|jgi:acid stress-induced BolA-like protein IbaG/YrbA|nr:BolA family protein [Myxococcota bacterium]